MAPANEAGIRIFWPEMRRARLSWQDPNATWVLINALPPPAGMIASDSVRDGITLDTEVVRARHMAGASLLRRAEAVPAAPRPAEEEAVPRVAGVAAQRARRVVAAAGRRALEEVAAQR